MSSTTLRLAENTNTSISRWLADIASFEAPQGGLVSLSGADADRFEVVGHALYLKAGVSLDYESRYAALLAQQPEWAMQMPARVAYDVDVDVRSDATPLAAVLHGHFALEIDDVNEAATGFSFPGATVPLAENTLLTTARKVSDVIVIDDALGDNTLSLSGVDVAYFELIGKAIYLRAGTVLDYESKRAYSVTVSVTDATLNGAPTRSATFILNLSDVNEAPTGLALTNRVGSLVENTSTASRLKVADIVVTDDALGSNTITLSGADAAMFEVVGKALYLKAGVSLDYETRSNLSVVVTVADGTVFGSSPLSATYALNVDNVNEAPTLSLTNTVAILAENTSTASRVRVADIVVTDDALGSHNVSLGGSDAASFEIVGNALYLKAGVALDYEVKASYAVAVTVTDPSLASTTSAAYTLSVVNLNEAPSAVSLANVVSSLPENTDTLNRLKVADIVVTDDALGSNTITLTGADAAKFERIGNALYLRAGVALDFETQSSYSLDVSVTDSSVIGSVPANASYTLNIGNVNEAPSAIGLVSPVNSLMESVSTASRIKVADIAVTDDALGSNEVVLGGTDAASFEIDGNGLYLKAGVSLSHATKPTFAVSVSVSDATVAGSTPRTTTFNLSIGDASLPVFLSGTSASLAEAAAAGATVYDANASEDGHAADVGITYSLSGVDAALFSIDATTGVVRSRIVANAAAPADGDRNNVYVLQVKARESSGNEAVQTVQVTLSGAEQIIWGDGSGYGRSASSSLLAFNGGGDADALAGTVRNDVIFGDGSGGGLINTGTGGLGGGGADNIAGGEGDDLIFGDGFSTTTGDGGYGGGAGGQENFKSAGVGGIGAGNGAWGQAYDGTASWLGPVNQGWRYQFGLYGQTWISAAASGGGVRNGNSNQGNLTDSVTASLSAGAGASAPVYGNRSVYDKVLWDLSQGTTGYGTGTAATDATGSGNGGTNIDARLYSQATGSGADVLRGGRGNDWIMGGGGADTFVWHASDLDGGRDMLVDFSVAGGDRLLLNGVLNTAALANLAAWVRLETGLSANSPFSGGAGSYSRLSIDRDGLGDFSAPEQIILLRGDALAGFGDAQGLLAAGVLQIENTSSGQLQVALQKAIHTLSARKDGDVTSGRIRLAEVVVSGGSSVGLHLEGADAANFELDGQVLYLRSGMLLAPQARNAYAVNVCALDATTGAEVATRYELGVTPFSAEAVRDDILMRLRALDLSPMKGAFQNWYSDNYANWTAYLVKDISATEYAQRLAAGSTGYQDYYGVNASPGQPINWIAAGGTNSYWSSPFIGVLAAWYYKTSDEKYLNRYLQILQDMALNERLASATLTSSQRMAKGIDIDNGAGALLEVATFMEAVVTGLAVFAKNLESSRIAVPIWNDWAASLGSRTSALSSDTLSLVSANQLTDVAIGLMASYAPSLMTQYESPLYLPNQRITGLAAMYQMQYIFSGLTENLPLADRTDAAIALWIRQVLYPDGGLLEPSFNYDQGSIEVLNKIARLDPTSTWHDMATAGVENFARMIAALASPMGSSPQVGNNVWATSASGSSAYHFTNESILMPYSGYAAQRDSWNSDAAYLFLYDKRWFNGHSTAGGNSIQLAANGQRLLVIGGTPDYDFSNVNYPSSVSYLGEESTWKTSTILVDSQSQRNSKAAQLDYGSLVYPNPKDTRWLDTPTLDYMEANWDFGYGKFGQIAVQHQRKVVFLEEQRTWVVIDVMQSPNAQHDYTQIWKFAPPKLNGTTQTGGFYKSQVVVDGDNERIVAASGVSASSVNLSIRQFSQTDITYSKYWGQDGDAYGYYTENYGYGDVSFSVDVHAKFAGSSASGQLGDAVVISVLRPFTGQSGIDDGLTAVNRSDGDSAGVDLTFVDGRTVSISAASTLATLSAAGVSLSGTDLLVVASGGGKQTQVLSTGTRGVADASYLVDGTTVTNLIVPDSFAWQTNGDGSLTEILNSHANAALSAVGLQNTLGSVLETNAATTGLLKVADIQISDDGLGSNAMTLIGSDASAFTVIGKTLYLKAGVMLDYEVKSSYAVTVSVADSSLAGSTPVTANYSLAITDVDDTPAAVQAVRIVSASGIDNGVLDAGDNLSLQVDMTRAVALTGGNATLVLNIGGVLKQASFTGVSEDGTHLNFSYTVPNGVLDASGIGFNANSVGLAAGATLSTLGNGLGAVLTHAAVADNAGYKIGPKMTGVYVNANTHTDTIGAATIYETDQYGGYFNTMPKLDGKAAANAALTLSWADGAQTRNITANASGAWGYTLTQADLVSMGVGTETVSATYSDGQGHTVTSRHDIRVNAYAQTSMDAAESGYGSDYIDALVKGGAGWKYPVITYSFAQTENGSVSDWTALEMQSFRDACQLYANVCNVQFVEGVFDAHSYASTNITLYKYTSAQMVGGPYAGAEFYQPVDVGYANRVIEGHFNVDYWSAPTPGSYAYYATIHEIAHGLGLDHPFDGDPLFPGVTGDGNGGYTAGDHDLNNGMWSILSYNFDWPQESYVFDNDGHVVAGMSQTPMSFDIAALQELYGANTNHHTGDDTYTIPDTTTIQGGWTCIWDAGGNDTISHAGAASACTINLNAYPKMGGVDSAPFVSYAPGAPVGFTIADGVVIENAIGGNGDDTIIGNAVANHLSGGGGADSFVFSKALSAGSVDTLVDFSVTEGDRIVLSKAIFSALAGLSDVTGKLVSGAGLGSAATVNDVLIYDTATGTLYYDADGSGASNSAIEFAVLSTKSALNASQFVLVA